MPVGTPYIPDTVADAAGGVTKNLTKAQAVTKFGASFVKEATLPFSITYRGQVISMSKGQFIITDAALNAALTAAGAPVT